MIGRTNGVQSASGGAADAFMYYTDMAPTRGSDGHTYLDQDFGLTKPRDTGLGMPTHEAR